MLSSEQKQRLEDQFFLNDVPPDYLNAEELEYWGILSNQWNRALFSVYGKSLQQDKHG